MQSVKLKIVYVLTAGGVGGAQRYVRDLAASLPKDRFETKILSGGENLRWLSNRISPFFLVNDWLALFELAAAFRRERPNIIHLNSSKAGVLGSFAAFIYNSAMRPFGTPKAKVVFTAHGWVFNPANHPPLMVRRAYAFFHRAAALFQDAIINVSNADYRIAIESRIAPFKKLFTVPNGIDPNIPFFDRQTSREKILQKLEAENRGFKANRSSPWIGSIGRLTKEKNYETLIRSIERVPKVHCFIIGDGSEREKLKALIRGLDLEARCAIVPGGGADDALMLKAFDLFVLPSIKEGLPYTLLEAGAAYVPAIVTDAGGMGEVFEAFPMCVVPKRNPDAIALKIKEFFENPHLLGEARNALSKAIHDRYRLDHMVRATEAIYRSLFHTP